MPPAELLVLVSGERLLGDDGPAMLIERPKSRPVGLASALLRERVGSLEQPERGANRLAPATHAEQAAHAGDLSAQRLST